MEASKDDDTRRDWIRLLITALLAMVAGGGGVQMMGSGIPVGGDSLAVLQAEVKRNSEDVKAMKAGFDEMRGLLIRLDAQMGQVRVGLDEVKEKLP